MTNKTILTLLLICINITVGYTQTIINAEKLVNSTKKNIYSLSLAYSGTSGNLETSKLDIAPTFIILNLKNEYKLFGGYSFEKANGSSIQNSGFAYFRHNYKISDKLKTLAFFQIQNNSVLLLEKRIVYGAGLRYAFINKDSLSYHLELGLMRELEKLENDVLLLNELDETKDFRISNVHSFKYILNPIVSINNVIYYQPSIKDFADFRALNDFNLVVKLTTYLSFITKVNTRYDSKPPTSLESWDNSVSVALNFSYSK